DKLPPVKDRRDDRLEPTEKLAAPDSKEVTAGDARSSIKNGDYTLALDKDGNLILTGKDGEELWGYSGADAADLLTDPTNDVKVGLDGSIKVIDRQTGKVVKVIREAGDPKHAKLVLLFHPPAESEPLRFAIDEAQSTLQLQVDCFGKGKAGLAEDVGNWLHNQGLADKTNKSAITHDYNDSYLDYDTQVKKHFKDLDSKIRSIALNTEQINSDAFKSIINSIDELNEQLHAIDGVKDTQVVSVGQNGDHTYRQILPDLEDDLFKAIDKTVMAVDKVVDNAHQAHAEGKKDTDKNTHDSNGYGKDNGGNGNGNGNGNGSGNGDGNGVVAAADTTADPIDFNSELGLDGLGDGAFGDTDGLTTAEDLTGSDGTTDTTGATGTTGTGSDISSKLDQAIAQIQNAATSGGSTGGGSGGSSGSASNPYGGMSNPYGMSGSNPLSSMTNPYNLPQQLQNQYGNQNGTNPYSQLAGNNAATAAATNPQTLTNAANSAVSAATATPVSANSNAMVDADINGLGRVKLPAGTLAEAFNHAINDPNGSDAHAAYTGTGGQETATRPWTNIGEGQVKTGDVVQFEHRSALVYVDANNKIFAIVGGSAVPLDTASPPDASFGSFMTFKHPTGLDG
ncbi:hypothetical protein, partial [Nocardia vinacea]|uniref:hypothetical protein n=1 Tax=Nocardia vinacea TaxID=96468 RepID=UPI0005949A94